MVHFSPLAAIYRLQLRFTKMLDLRLSWVKLIWGLTWNADVCFSTIWHLLYEYSLQYRSSLEVMGVANHAIKCRMVIKFGTVNFKRRPSCKSNIILRNVKRGDARRPQATLGRSSGNQSFPAWWRRRSGAPRGSKRSGKGDRGGMRGWSWRYIEEISPGNTSAVAVHFSDMGGTARCAANDIISLVTVFATTEDDDVYI